MNFLLLRCILKKYIIFINVIECKTEFQTYLKYNKNVIDLTEKRLLRAIKRATTNRVRKNLVNILNSYKECKIAIAWSNGHAHFHQI